MAIECSEVGFEIQPYFRFEFLLCSLRFELRCHWKKGRKFLCIFRVVFLFERRRRVINFTAFWSFQVLYGLSFKCLFSLGIMWRPFDLPDALWSSQPVVFPWVVEQLAALETVCLLVPLPNSHAARAWLVFPPHHYGPTWSGSHLIRISRVQGSLGFLSA